MAGLIPPLTSNRPRLTNVGIPLQNDYRGGESDTVREIPPEWRAALDLQVIEQPVPLDTLIFELTDEILASKLEQTVTSEKHLRTTRKGHPGPYLLFERFTNKNKEFGLRTKVFNYTPTDFDFVPTPGALREVNTRNFGNQHFETIVEDLQGLFVADSYMRERPIVIPTDFRAGLEEDEHSFNEIGIASDPGNPLPPGVISHRDEQSDVYIHREAIRSIDLLNLPKFIVNAETNRAKQQVAVVRKLDLDSVAPPFPNATSDVEFTTLGDGTALTIQKNVDSVFDELGASIEIADLLPEIFRTAFPIFTEDFEEAGTTIDDPPTLGTGELYRENKRTTEYTRHIRRKYRNVENQSRVLSRQFDGVRFGGEVMATTATLSDSEPPVETGLDVIVSQVKDLGSGMWIRETERWDTAIQWPTLELLKFDPEMQVYTTLETQVVDPSYTPLTDTYYSEQLEPIDQTKSRRSRHTRQPDAVSVDTALLSEVWGPFQFPGWLAFTGLGYYVRKARSELCQQLVKTWWLSSPTKPTVGPTGSGADVEVDPILMDNPIISTLNNVTTLAYAGECLHDDFTSFGVLHWNATTPTATDYTTNWIGTMRVIKATVKPTEIKELWKIQTYSIVMR